MRHTSNILLYHEGGNNIINDINNFKLIIKKIELLYLGHVTKGEKYQLQQNIMHRKLIRGN